MSSIEVVDDQSIIEFRGRGLVSGEPDATNIVIIDNTQELEQTGQPHELSIPDAALSITIEEPNYAIQMIGIQGARGQDAAGEDSVLDDDQEIDFIDDDNWYKGWAPAGTPTDAAGWKIQLTSIYNAEGDARKRWADGTATYDKVWDDHLTYTY